MILKVLDRHNHFWMYGNIQRIHWFCWSPKEDDGDQSQAIPNDCHSIIDAIDPSRPDAIKYAVYFRQKGADEDANLIVLNTEAFIMNDDGKTVEILRSM